MKENRIDLTFQKLMTDLAGNPLGRSTFLKQVEPYLKMDEKNVVVIPDTINDVGSSFVQGLYYKIAEKHGKARALEIMQIDCSKENIKEKIKNSIETYGI